MKMKRIGLVLLGIVTSAVVAVPLGFVATMFIPTNAPVAIVQVLLIIPIALFIGSSATGYYSYVEIESRRAFLLLAPGLYCGLLLICQYGVSRLLETCDPLSFIMGLFSPVIALWWYVVSLAGVKLGYNIREHLD
jgi:hypothetical protein